MENKRKELEAVIFYQTYGTGNIKEEMTAGAAQREDTCLDASSFLCSAT